MDKTNAQFIAEEFNTETARLLADYYGQVETQHAEHSLAGNGYACEYTHGQMKACRDLAAKLGVSAEFTKAMGEGIVGND